MPPAISHPPPEPTEPTEVPAPAGDWTLVARPLDPVDAQLRCNCLVAAGLSARIADEQHVLADSLIGIAMGGVRVMVPASQVSAARAVLAEFDAGTYALDATDAAPSEDPVLLWSPDAAWLWSFLLTPMFGAWLHLVNAKALGEARLLRQARIWLVLNTVGTAWCVMRAVEQPKWLVMVGVLTVFWYALAGNAQSRHIAARWGTRYPRRPLLAGVLAGLVLIPMVLALFCVPALWRQA